MLVTATVRVWHDDVGWGVLDAAETPGGCWCHFSAIRLSGDRVVQSGRTDGGDSVEFVDTGYRSLEAGNQVEADVVEAEQDGYHFRAESVRRLDDSDGISAGPSPR